MVSLPFIYVYIKGGFWVLYGRFWVARPPIKILSGGGVSTQIFDLVGMDPAAPSPGLVQNMLYILDLYDTIYSKLPQNFSKTAIQTFNTIPRNNFKELNQF